MLNIAEFCKNQIMQRFNIPQNITNPENIVQYLLNTGQYSQTDLNKAIELSRNQDYMQQLQQYLGLFR